MKKRILKIHRLIGLSITETIIAMTTLAIVVLGVMNFRYYGSKESWLANVEMTAARVGLLMLESWKGTGGSPDWNPAEQMAYQLKITPSGSGPAIPDGMNGMGIFRVNISPGDTKEIKTFLVDTWNVDYYVTLAYDDATEIEPKMLNVSVGWMYQDGEWGTSKDAEIPVSLTAYVQ